MKLVEKMEPILIELKTVQLLEKFGAGNHKPGSGSAAALQGMLAAQLIRTVIALTTDPKRPNRIKNYSKWIPELSKFNDEIQDRIYPNLEKLFQEDSVQFGKVIKRRNSRDIESDRYKRRQADNEALKELKIATKIPLQIARLCLELAERAIFVVDHGFKSASGDSTVALNGALSAVPGCIAIIHLNLSSFEANEWTKEVRAEADSLRSGYENLLQKSILRLESQKKELDEKLLLSSLLASLKPNKLSVEIEISDSEIEEKARQLQIAMWQYRRRFRKKDPPESPIKLLNPEIALKKLGYEFSKKPSLGRDHIQGRVFEVAGLIDNEKSEVAISEQFPLEIQKFTAAHELGHALLHHQNVLHRDMPMDGPVSHFSRSKSERQADKFASYFLMPTKLVKKTFRELFLNERLEINEDTLFALNETSIESFRKKCKNLRGFARFVAEAEVFDGKYFDSISKQFGVSVGAMAIRLEELDLIRF